MDGIGLNLYGTWLEVKYKLTLGKKGYASIWTGLMEPDRHEILQIFGFCSKFKWIDFFEIYMIHNC